MPSSSEINLTGTVVAAAPNIDRFMSNLTEHDPNNGKYLYKKIVTNTFIRIIRRTTSPDKSGNHRYICIEFGRLKKDTDAGMDGVPEEAITESSDEECVLDLFQKYNKAACDMFNYLMIQANCQCYSGKSKAFINSTITFKLQDLVDAGIYDSMDKARIGFDRGAEAVSSIKIIAWNGKTCNPKLSNGYTVIQPFREPSRHYGSCSIEMSTKAEWGKMFHSFYFLPIYSFKLNSASGNLLKHICDSARQNWRDILRDGYFTIRMRTIHVWMNLPDVRDEKNKKNAHLTVKRIRDAVEDINSNQRTYCGNDDLLLDTSLCDGFNRAVDFIDKGYLKIWCRGEYADYLKTIASAEEEKKQRRERKQLRKKQKTA